MADTRLREWQDMIEAQRQRELLAPDSLPIEVLAKPSVYELRPSERVIDGGQTVTVDGRNFRPDSTVLLDGVPGATTFIDKRRLHVEVPASTVEATVAVAVRQVVNGVTLVSNALPFTWRYPTPVLTVIDPPGRYTHEGPTPIACYGSGFVATSTIQVDGVPIATEYLGPTYVRSLAALQPPTGPTTLQITVATGSEVSAPQPFTWDQIPAAVISNVVPPAPTIGNPPASFVVGGSGFRTESRIFIFEEEIATVYVSGTTLNTQTGALPPTPGGPTPWNFTVRHFDTVSNMVDVNWRVSEES